MTTLSEVAPNLTNMVSNANTALGAIASQNENLSLTLQELPPTLRQGNTTFVNLRAALDDVEPLLRANGRAADAGLAELPPGRRGAGAAPPEAGRLRSRDGRQPSPARATMPTNS